MNDKTLNTVLIFLIVGVIFIMIAPYLFTRPLGILNFKDTGNIGDTIGGITSPITSLLGSILVFFALKAQIDANKLIQKQIESQNLEEQNRKKVQYISEQVNFIRTDINEFSYTDTETKNGGKQKFNYTGADAINNFLVTLRHIGESHEEEAFLKIPKLIELFNLLNIIDLLFDRIEHSSIANEDKQYFKSLLTYQFNLKIKPAFTINEQHRARNLEPCKSCGKKHKGIPDKLFDLIDKISAR